MYYKLQLVKQDDKLYKIIIIKNLGGFQEFVFLSQQGIVICQHAQCSQFRVRWGFCPGNRIALANTLIDNQWLRFPGVNCKMPLKIRTAEQKTRFFETMSMRLTCQGRRAQLYPLLDGARPSSSCWRSCFSAKQLPTCGTNTSI